LFLLAASIPLSPTPFGLETSKDLIPFCLLNTCICSFSCSFVCSFHVSYVYQCTFLSDLMVNSHLFLLLTGSYIRSFFSLSFFRNLEQTVQRHQSGYRNLTFFHHPTFNCSTGNILLSKNDAVSFLGKTVSHVLRRRSVEEELGECSEECREGCDGEEVEECQEEVRGVHSSMARPTGDCLNIV